MYRLMLADSGSEGALLVGAKTYSLYKDWLIREGKAVEADFSTVSNSNLVYKFGMGTSSSQRTVRFPIKSWQPGNSMQYVEADIVNIPLPFIAGHEFLARQQIALFPGVNGGTAYRHTMVQQKGTTRPTIELHPLQSGVPTEASGDAKSTWLSLEVGSDNGKPTCATVFHNIGTPGGDFSQEEFSPEVGIVTDWEKWDASQRQLEQDAEIARVLFEEEQTNTSPRLDSPSSMRSIEDEWQTAKKTFKPAASSETAENLTHNSFAQLSPDGSGSNGSVFSFGTPAPPVSPRNRQKLTPKAKKVKRSVVKQAVPRPTTPVGREVNFSQEELDVATAVRRSLEQDDSPAVVGHVSQAVRRIEHTVRFNDQRKAAASERNAATFSTRGAMRAMRKTRNESVVYSTNEPVNVSKISKLKGCKKSRSIQQRKTQRQLLTQETRKEKFLKHFPSENLFTLNDNQLQKIHLHGHAPISRICKFLFSTVPFTERQNPEVRKQLASVRKRLKGIVAACPCSKARKPHEGMPTKTVNLRTFSEGFNKTVELDGVHIHKDELRISSAQFRILTITDRGTGWTEFVSVKDLKTETIAKAFLINWVNWAGAPHNIVWTDFGSEFIGESFRGVCQALGLLKLNSAPRVAQAHGFVETRNRFLRQSLRATASDVGLDMEDLPLILSTFSNEYNNSNIRLYNGQLSTPSLRVFGFSTSSFRNALNDTVGSAFHESHLVEVSEKARAIWIKESSDKKLRKILRANAPSSEFKNFFQNQLVYYNAGVGSEFMWKGPAVVVGLNGTTKYAFLDFGGVLVHAHFSCLRECTDRDCVLEGLENSHTPIVRKEDTPLSSSEVPDVPETDGEWEEEDPISRLERLSNTPSSHPPRFQHNFETNLEHPLLPRTAGPGARGWQRLATGTKVPGERSRASSVPVGTGRTHSPRGRVSGDDASAVCQGCRNGHKRHDPSCPFSMQFKERQRTLRQEAKSREPTPPPTTVEPKVTRKEQLKAKAAVGSGDIRKMFGSSDVHYSYTAVNVVRPQLGQRVRTREGFRGFVTEVNDDYVSIKGDDFKKTKMFHVGNVTVLRNGVPMTTSLSNAERLVQHRQRIIAETPNPHVRDDCTPPDLASIASTADLRELAQLIAGGRNCREVEGSHSLLSNRLDLDALSDQTIYDGDHFNDIDSLSNHSDVSEHFAPASRIHEVYNVELLEKVSDEFLQSDFSIDVTPNSGNSLPKRKFIHSHEASDIDFNDLPDFMQKQAYAESLRDFYVGECWTQGGTLGEWKAMRRRAQNLEKQNIPTPAVVIMDSTWVTKATVNEAEDAPVHPTFGKLRGKVRLAPRGFREKGLRKQDLGAPTVSPTTMKLAEAFCLSQRTTRKLVPCKIDFRRAFFQIKEFIDEKEKKSCLVLPKECQAGRQGDNRLVMRLRKEVPGTKSAPMAWNRTISRVLIEKLGFQRSRVDPCLYFRHVKDGSGTSLHSVIFIHVDDSRIWIPLEDLGWLREGLKQAGIETRYISVIEAGHPSDLVGMRWTTDANGTKLDQQPYVEKHIKTIPTEKLDAKIYNTPGSIKIHTNLYDSFRSLLGKCIWLLKTRSEFEFDVSILASRVHRLQLSDIHYINDLAQSFISTKEYALYLPSIEVPHGEHLELIGVCDASLAGRDDESSQGARGIGLTSSNSDSFAPIEISSRKVRRRGSSSFDVEMLTVVDCADMMVVIRLLFEELAYGTRPSLMHRILLEVEGFFVERPIVRCVIDTDARDCVERIYSIKDALTISKRRRVDVTDCQDLIVFRDISEFRHVAGSSNPMDVGTKKYGKHGISKEKSSYQRLLQMLYHGIYVPDLTSHERSGEFSSAKQVYMTRLDRDSGT